MRHLVNSTILALKPEIKYSLHAENLVLGTGAQESAYGKYTKQIGGGPALGKFQMEPETHNDIWKNFLKYKPRLAKLILEISGLNEPDFKDLETNDTYACAMCRVHYFRVKEPIPTTLNGYAYYWKQYYNTPKGKGTISEFINNYLKYVKS